MAQLHPSSNVDTDKYMHSPAHHAVACKNYPGLEKIISGLPKLRKGDEIRTEAEAIAEEQKVAAVSAIIDDRDVEGRETPLHLAVKLRDAVSVKLLMRAGADATLQNQRGWSPLQEAISSGQETLAVIILKHHQPLAWNKWCRRFPRFTAAMKRMKDFYMELTFHFESPVIPFLAKVAPSDTFRIWKQGPNLRVDMTLAGFEGLTVQRSNKSFLFFGEGSPEDGIPRGSLCIVDHKRKKVKNALEGMERPVSDARIARHVAVMAKSNLYRPGLDVTGAVLVPQLSWTWQAKVETVGSNHWKARAYDMHNVILTFKSKKVSGALTDEELFKVLQDLDDADDLLLDEEDEDAVVVGSPVTKDEKHNQNGDRSREANRASSSSSSSASHPREDRKKWFSWGWRGKSSSNKAAAGGKDMDTSRVNEEVPRRSARDEGSSSSSSSSKETSKRVNDRSSGSRRSANEMSVRPSKDGDGSKKAAAAASGDDEESEFKKVVKPVLWLTSDFPLSTQELLPLLDILASKVKAVRRVRELLTTRLPPGTFPVKVALPVIPTVKVLLAFTKFKELQPPAEECFLTPTCSPVSSAPEHEEEAQSSPWFSWFQGSTAPSVARLDGQEQQASDLLFAIAIPHDYVLSGFKATPK